MYIYKIAQIKHCYTTLTISQISFQWKWNRLQHEIAQT